MDPLLLQQQLKNNNQDVKDIYKDLKIWGTEMEQKEEIRKLGELQSRVRIFIFIHLTSLCISLFCYPAPYAIIQIARS